MLELILTLLVTVGVLDVDSREPDLVALDDDATPTYAEVVCYIECAHWCLWEGPPLP